MLKIKTKNTFKGCYNNFLLKEKPKKGCFCSTLLHKIFNYNIYAKLVIKFKDYKIHFKFNI